MTARKTTRTRKTTVAAVIEQPRVEDPTNTLFTEYLAAQDRLLAHLGSPSFARTCAAFIASALASIGAAYLISGLVETIVVATLALTTSATFSFVIWCFGIFAAIYASSKVGLAVFDYVVKGTAEQHARDAWHGAKNLFSRVNNSVRGRFA